MELSRFLSEIWPLLIVYGVCIVIAAAILEKLYPGYKDPDAE